MHAARLARTHLHLPTSNVLSGADPALWPQQGTLDSGDVSSTSSLPDPTYTTRTVFQPLQATARFNPLVREQSTLKEIATVSTPT